MLKRIFETPDDPILTLMRLLLGIVYLPHGAQKLLGWFGGLGFHGTIAVMARTGIPPFLTFLVIMVEFFGALGLIFGCLTRIAALGIFIDMLVAVLKVHIHVGFFMNWAGRQKGEGFEFHLLVFAIAIPLIIRGAGAFSVDRLIAGETSTRR